MGYAGGMSDSWSQTVTARLFGWAAAALVVVGVACVLPLLLVDAGPGDDQGARVAGAVFSTVVIVVCVVLLWGFTRIRVSVDGRGLLVTLPLLFGMRVKSIPLSRVETVSADHDLRPAQWGGWGYRVMPGRSAIVLRRGPALVIGTTADKYFAVTLDDPETPAVLLATLTAGEAGRAGATAKSQ